MSVKVRFFASLRESLGSAGCQLDARPGLTVAGVWAQAAPGRPMGPRVLAAVNQDYARPDDAVDDGDEVAFFPPVTGG